MTKDELQSAVDSMFWYHKIELPHGIVTPGWAPFAQENYRLPDDLSGKRVLDIGTYDGYWTFECLKRGAAEVVAIDDFSDAIYQGEKRSWAQFDLCRKAFGYSPQQCWHEETSVYDLSQLQYQSDFDLVLFLGVLYHCKHPLLALERIRAICRPGAMILVESAILDDYSAYEQHGYGDRMVMEFYPDNQYGNCHTNWWVPTLRTMMNMMRVAGFVDVKGWKIDNPKSPMECRGYAHGFVA